MGRPKKYPNGSTRIVVRCTVEQERLIAAAAHASGADDRGTWVLAHAMDAAVHSTGIVESDFGQPMVIDGELAKRIRGAAEQQGIGPHAVLEQWATTKGKRS